MTTKTDGGPAFPDPGRAQSQKQRELLGNQGMSLRDYFAATAMQGMLAYPGCEQRGSHHNNNTPSGVAAMAYRYADAMLKVREEA